MYIGWDIGIKNLSYCLLDILDNTSSSINNVEDKTIINIGDKKFILVDWGVINILNDVTNNTPCFENRKKVDCGFGKCKRKATYVHEKKNSSNYFGLCTIHYKKINDEKKKEFIMLEKKPKCFNVNCKKSALYYDKRHEFKTYCGTHFNQELRKSPSFDCVKVNKKVKATNINLTKLGSSLNKLLDAVPTILKVKCVLLENQPVLKNPTMKSMQMFLYSYYILRGITDYNKNGLTEPIKSIKCYSANQKNKVGIHLSDELQHEIKEALKTVKNKYTKNKKETIMITERILNNHVEGNSTKWQDLFKNSKKKDDLADSFLMTLHYLLK